MLVIDWNSMLALTLHVLVVFVAGVYISLHRRPTTAIAWIVLIIFLPVVGVVLFFLVGSGKLPERRVQRQRQVNALMMDRSEVVAYRTVPHTPKWLRSTAALNEALGSLPMVRGNSATLLGNYHETLESMVADIDAATDFVHVQFYILVKDDTTTIFFDALKRASERGVTVRVLSDYLANKMQLNRKATLEALDEMGAEHYPLLSWNPAKGKWQRVDLRNHRKLLVVDGVVGYMGSQNLIDSSYLKAKNLRRGLRWKELMVRLEGPIVGELDAVFITDWFSETDQLLPILLRADRPAGPPYRGTVVPDVDAQVVPSGPTFANDNNLKLFVHLIHSAKKRISITSPYFVPDESTILALVTAAARGVKVELFVSEVADQFFVYHAQRSYYSELLRAGVKIYLYRSPTVLHSKHFTIDNDVAVIGSSNMDIRSFKLNMEISLLVRSAEFVKEMRKVEGSYRRNSVQLKLSEWSNRPLPGKIADGVARLTSDLQ